MSHLRQIAIAVLLLMTISACSLTATRSADQPATLTPPPFSTSAVITPIPQINSAPIIVTATPPPTTASRPAVATAVPPPRATSTPVYTVYQPVSNVVVPLCAVAPAGNYSVNIRSGPGTNYAIVAALPVSNWVSAIQIAGGWVQVSVPGAQIPNNASWVASNFVTMQQPCTCGPNCAGNQPPPPSIACTITVGSQGATAFNQPYVGAAQFAFMPAGTTMQPSVRTANNWYGFDPGIAQAGNTGLDRLRWLLADNYVSLNGYCGSLPIVNVSPPSPTPVPTGRCMVAPGTVITAYMEPEENTTVFYSGDGGQIAIAGEITGWYAFEPGIAQAPNVGLYRLRWIPIPVNTVGDCTHLPYIEINPPTLPAGSNCLITPSTSATVTVYREAGADAGMWDGLDPGNSVQAVGVTSDGWYAVAANTGAVPPEVGIYALRWIYSGDAITLSGQGCDTLPAIVE